MTKLCPRGKAAAKRKFKVYPSAYANAYASKICAGKIKDPSGVKRKDFKGPKPMSKGGGADTGTVGEIRSKQGVIFNKVKRMVRDDKDLSPKRRKKILQQVKAKSEERMNRKNIERGIEFSKEFQRGRRELFMSTAGKRIPALKVGKAVTAGAQSGMGRLEKSGLMKNLPTTPAYDDGKYLGNLTKQEIRDYQEKQKENRNLRRTPRTKFKASGGEIKKANKGLHAENKKKKTRMPGDPNKRREYLRNIQNPVSEYDRKGKLKYTEVNSGGAMKIKKVIKGLKKASKLHAGQAKSLSTIKLSRGGGAAIRGTNFKGVF